MSTLTRRSFLTALAGYVTAKGRKPKREPLKPIKSDIEAPGYSEYPKVQPKKK